MIITRLIPVLLLTAPSIALITPSPAHELRPATVQTATSSYSILGYDPITGEFGVASASEAPLIGMNLEFLDLEAGGVLVHGGPHLEISERVMAALEEELPPDRAIQVGLFIDTDKENLQILAISQHGAAAFTGKKLEKHAADEVGDVYVAAGQRIPNPDIINAMAAHFQTSDGPLGSRLLGALRAGRNASGEEGGEGGEGDVHSAALLVVSPRARFATRNRLIDLRIDFVSGDAVAALEALQAQVDSVYGIN
ncbi:MAG: DUF1028 domain-containing protein [Gemmatimonadota bacterium]